MNHQSHKNMNKLLVCLLSLSILAACNKSKKNNEEEQEQQVIHDIDQLLSDLPDPSAIPYQLKAIDAEFADSLINSLDNMAKYKGDPDKMAMNMGVYSADVSYLASYGKSDMTMSYVKACHEIGEALGDSEIFKDDLLAKIESSLGNEEELSKHLRSMIVETSIQLEKDHHLSMAALALTGAFIEEMYQAVNVIDNYHGAGLSSEEDKAKVEPLVKLVLAQEQALLDLIKLIEDIPHDGAIREILSQLRILDNLYKG